MQASAMGEFNFLEDPTMVDVTRHVNSTDDCAGCATLERVKCPAAYEYIVNEVVRPSIYSWVVGSRIVDICTTKEELTSSFVKTEAMMADLYASKFHVKEDKMNSCFRSLKHTPQQEVQKKAMTSYIHGLNNNITELQKEKISAIASIDTMLGQPAINDVYCEENYSFCHKLKTCKPHPEQVDETIDFSIASLKEIIKLENQLKDLRKIQASKERLDFDDFKLARDDVLEKIDMVKSMNPWFEGDQVKAELSEVKQSLARGNDKDAGVRLKKSFISQLKKTREAEKKEFINLNTTQDCLINDSFCSDKVLNNMNSYYVKNDHSFYKNSELNRDEIFEANVVKYSGSCIANLKKDKEGMDELNSMVGGTLVGLGVGGVGGVIKLGQLALTVYKSGNAIKGVASAGLLAAEGKMIHDSLTSVANNCERAMNRVKNAKLEKDNNACSEEAKGIYKVSDLKSCVVDVALTTLPYALSLRGVGKSLAGMKDEVEIAKNESVMIANKIKNTMFDSLEKEEIASTLQRLNLTPDELEEILKKMNEVVKTDLDKNRLKNYVNFVMSLNPSEHKLAMNELHDVALLSSNLSPGSYVQKFHAKENKFYIYEKYKEKSFKNNLIKAGRTEEQAIEASKVMARQSRASLQKRFYSCQSKTMTPDHKTAAKRYMGISLALGIGGTTYGSYKNNTEKFENDKAEWFSKLGYDIAITYIMTKINAKFVGATGTQSMGVKYLQGNVNLAMVGTLDAVVYSKLYGVSEEEAVRRLEEIKNSPSAQKELKVLEAYIDKNNVADKFSDKMIEDYKTILDSPSKEEIIGKAPYVIGDEVFTNLTPADLDKPEIKEKLVHALLRQLNSGENGPLISSGDKGADRWINDRIWNAAIGIPKGLIVGMGIYQVLCLGIDKPFASLGVVTGIQFINQFASGDAYYKFRKEMIGQ